MNNRVKTTELFSISFRLGLQKQYGEVPSSNFISMQFNLRAHGTSTVGRETARKWSNGLAFPSPSHLFILIKWLKLNPSDFLVELMESNKPDSFHLNAAINTNEKNKVCAQQILDSLSLQIAVTNFNGEIVQVNKSWRKFSASNSKIPDENFFLGYNYLRVCENAVGSGTQTARDMALGIRNVLNGELEDFAVKYLCHAPNKKRWFIGRVAPLKTENAIFAVISHESISEKNYLKIEFDEVSTA